jgi:filamentous hemagglutinin family protein
MAADSYPARAGTAAQRHRRRGSLWGVIPSSLALLVASLGAAAAAEDSIRADGTMKEASKVQRVEAKDGTVTYQITGGAHRSDGRLLFHSFSAFGLNTREIADFANDIGVQSIFSRVTGGTRSQIDGLIKAAGSANLYLINPKGIAFGPNATIQVGGSFIATTAKSLTFGDNVFAAEGDVKDIPLVISNITPGLQYGSGGGELTVAGTLTVNDGNQIVLAAGPNDNVTVTGSLKAPGGTIEISDGNGANALGTGTVTISGTLSNQNTNAGDGGAITLKGKTVNVQSGGQVLSSTTGSGSGAPITVEAQTVDVSGQSILASENSGSGKGGSIQLKGASVSIWNATATTQTSGGGDGGLLSVDAQTLSLRGSSKLSTQTSSTGKGGSISIQNTGADTPTLTVNLNTTGSSLTTTSSSQATTGGGVGGNITIGSTDKILNVSGPGQISATTSGSGNGGNLSLKGSTISLDQRVTATTKTSGSGKGGPILVSTGDLRLAKDTAVLSTTTHTGSGGGVVVTPATASQLTITGPGRIETEASGTGTAGPIQIGSSPAPGSPIASGTSLLQGVTLKTEGSSVNVESSGTTSLQNSSIEAVGSTVQLKGDERVAVDGSKILAPKATDSSDGASSITLRAGRIQVGSGAGRTILLAGNGALKEGESTFAAENLTLLDGGDNGTAATILLNGSENSSIELFSGAKTADGIKGITTLRGNTMVNAEAGSSSPSSHRIVIGGLVGETTSSPSVTSRFTTIGAKTSLNANDGGNIDLLSTEKTAIINGNLNASNGAITLAGGAIQIGSESGRTLLRAGQAQELSKSPDGGLNETDPAANLTLLDSAITLTAGSGKTIEVFSGKAGQQGNTILRSTQSPSTKSDNNNAIQINASGSRGDVFLGGLRSAGAETVLSATSVGDGVQVSASDGAITFNTTGNLAIGTDSRLQAGNSIQLRGNSADTLDATFYGKLDGSSSLFVQQSVLIDLTNIRPAGNHRLSITAPSINVNKISLAEGSSWGMNSGAAIDLLAKEGDISLQNLNLSLVRTGTSSSSSDLFRAVSEKGSTSLNNISVITAQGGGVYISGSSHVAIANAEVHAPTSDDGRAQGSITLKGGSIKVGSEAGRTVLLAGSGKTETGESPTAAPNITLLDGGSESAQTIRLEGGEGKNIEIFSGSSTTEATKGVTTLRGATATTAQKGSTTHHIVVGGTFDDTDSSEAKAASKATTVATGTTLSAYNGGSITVLGTGNTRLSGTISASQGNIQIKGSSTEITGGKASADSSSEGTKGTISIEGVTSTTIANSEISAKHGTISVQGGNILIGSNSGRTLLRGGNAQDLSTKLEVGKNKYIDETNPAANYTLLDSAISIESLNDSWISVFAGNTSNPGNTILRSSTTPQDSKDAVSVTDKSIGSIWVGSRPGLPLEPVSATSIGSGVSIAAEGGAVYLSSSEQLGITNRSRISSRDTIFIKAKESADFTTELLNSLGGSTNWTIDTSVVFAVPNYDPRPGRSLSITAREIYVKDFSLKDRSTWKMNSGHAIDLLATEGDISLQNLNLSLERTGATSSSSDLFRAVSENGSTRLNNNSVITAAGGGVYLSGSSHVAIANAELHAPTSDDGRAQGSITLKGGSIKVGSEAGRTVLLAGSGKTQTGELPAAAPNITLLDGGSESAKTIKLEGGEGKNIEIFSGSSTTEAIEGVTTLRGATAATAKEGSSTHHIIVGGKFDDRDPSQAKATSKATTVGAGTTLFANNGGNIKILGSDKEMASVKPTVTIAGAEISAIGGKIEVSGDTIEVGRDSVSTILRAVDPSTTDNPKATTILTEGSNLQGRKITLRGLLEDKSSITAEELKVLTTGGSISIEQIKNAKIQGDNGITIAYGNYEEHMQLKGALNYDSLKDKSISILGKGIALDGFQVANNEPWNPGAKRPALILDSKGGNIVIKDSFLNLSDSGGGATGLVSATVDNGIMEIANSTLSVDYTGTGDQTAGKIKLEGLMVNLSDSTRITARTSGDRTGGSIDILTNSLELDKSEITVLTTSKGNAGNINIRSMLKNGLSGNRDLTIKFKDLNSSIKASTSLEDPNSGEGGTITIGSADSELTISGPGKINAETTGSGKGGDLELKGSSISLSGTTATAQTSGSGKGGKITLSADTVALQDDSTLTTSSAPPSTNGKTDLQTSQRTGPAGTISIQSLLPASGIKLTLEDGSSIRSTTSSSNAYTSSEDLANIAIDLPSIFLGNDSLISAETSGKANAGAININQSYYSNTKIELAAGSTINASTSLTDPDGGEGGTITIGSTDKELIISGPGKINAETTGSGKGGDLELKGSSISLSNGITATTQTSGDGHGGTINLRSNSLELDRSTLTVLTMAKGDAGNIDINSTDNNPLSITFRAGSEINALADSMATGRGGDITIGSTLTPSLVIAGDGRITAETKGKGDSGFLNLNAVSSINLSNGITATTQTSGSGDGGRIDISARTINLSTGAKATAQTSGAGRGGILNVSANTIHLADKSSLTTTSAPLLPNGEPDLNTSQPTGPAGTIILRASSAPGSSLFLLTGSTIESRTSSSNPYANPRDLAFVYSNHTSFTLANGSSINTLTNGAAKAGGITLDGGGSNALTLSFSGRATINALADENATGRGGDIIIGSTRTPSLVIAGDGRITAETKGKGDGGFLNLNAVSSINLSNGITATTQTSGSGDGGRIDISANTINLSTGATATAQTSGTGRGGTLNVSANTIHLAGKSSLTTTSAPLLPNGEPDLNTSQPTGPAGTISLRAPSASGSSLFLLTGSTIESQTSSSNPYATPRDLAFVYSNHTSFTLANGSSIKTLTNGTAKAGGITLDGGGSNALALSFSGDATINALADENATGRGGDIIIGSTLTPSLAIAGDGRITAETKGKGNGGFLNLNAVSSINLSNGITATTQTSGSGDGGHIDISANTINLSTGARATAQTSGSGDGGSIDISANTINLSKGAKATAQTSGTGRGGRIDVQGNTITLDGGSEISVQSDPKGQSSSGPAGSISILANGPNSLHLTNRSAIRASTSSSQPFRNSKDLGSISIRTPNLELKGNSTISSASSGAAQGGSITIQADRVNLDGGSTITAAGTSTGQAGNINLFVDNDLTLTKESRITASTAASSTGRGGANIKIEVGGNILLFDNSSIRAEAFGSANGGNIILRIPNGFLRASFPVIGDGNDILAIADSGNGGLIDIRALAIFGFNTNTFLQPITEASTRSLSGRDGVLAIFTPLLNPDRGIVPIEQPLDPSNQLDQSCSPRAENSSFQTCGRGGVPALPGDTPGRRPALDDLGPPPAAPAPAALGPSRSSLR